MYKRAKCTIGTGRFDLGFTINKYYKLEIGAGPKMSCDKKRFKICGRHLP